MATVEQVHEYPPTETTRAKDEPIAVPIKNSWTPLFLHPIVEAAICFAFVVVAVGLEIMLHYNRKQHGFPIPLKSHSNIVQFLKSFIPTLAFLPLLYVLAKVFEELRVLQPYLELSRGRPRPANTTVTLEYVSKGPFATARQSYRHRHWILTIASLVMLYSGVFSPLAGALFAIKLSTFTHQVDAVSAGSLGQNLAAAGDAVTFGAAAGYMDASIYNNETLPAYIFRDSVTPDTDGWMIPPFGVGPGVNTDSAGSLMLQIRTQALQIHVDCVPANLSAATPVANQSNWSYNASLSEACKVQVTNSESDAGHWYGIMGKGYPDCAPLINNTAPSVDGWPAASYPVAIGFARSPVAYSAVFCYGYQRAFNVTAVADLRTGRVTPNLTDVVYSYDRNLEGYVFNGVNFLDPSQDLIIGRTLGGAVILRAGKPNATSVGIDQDRQNRLLGTTNTELASLVAHAFLGYALVAANSVWVIGPQYVSSGILSTEKGRIIAITPAVHTLAILCLITAFVFMGLFILHGRERRGLRLRDRPRPSIAGIGALLYPTGWNVDQGHDQSDHGDEGDSGKSDPQKLKRPTLAGKRASTSLFNIIGPEDTHSQIKDKLKDKTFSLSPEGVVVMSP